MTSRLLTPWWRPRPADAARSGAAGSAAPTPTLDWRSVAVQSLLHELHAAGADDGDARALLVRAHGLIAARVRPVYALDDTQPASRTLVRSRGSCSQRLAVLEAVARGSGIQTRVRGLLVDGRFWYPRFPQLRMAVPHSVLLAWPEFLIDTRWVAASEIFGSLQSLSGSRGFSNADGETLFDAVARTAVD